MLKFAIGSEGLKKVLGSAMVFSVALMAGLFFVSPSGDGFMVSPALAQEAAANPPVANPAGLGTVPAEGDPNHRPGFGEVLYKMLPMFVMVFFIFYFMVIKPQQQKLRSQQELVTSLKKGDSVVTTGGIIAKVAGVESDHVLIDVAPNVRLKIEPAHIAKRVEKKPSDKEKAAA